MPVAVCIQYQTPNDGQNNCPKDVEFYSKYKFEELVHLIGLIIITMLYRVRNLVLRVINIYFELAINVISNVK